MTDLRLRLGALRGVQETDRQTDTTDLPSACLAGPDPDDVPHLVCSGHVPSTSLTDPAHDISARVDYPSQHESKRHTPERPAVSVLASPAHVDLPTRTTPPPTMPRHHTPLRHSRPTHLRCGPISTSHAIPLPIRPLRLPITAPATTGHFFPAPLRTTTRTLSHHVLSALSD